jgi:hypothetical protein
VLIDGGETDGALVFGNGDMESSSVPPSVKAPWENQSFSSAAPPGHPVVERRHGM